jgi:large-conductance mechanosensitive channel
MNINIISQLKQFIMDNNTIGTIAGVCIGASAKDFIHAMVSSMIFPGLKKSLTYIPLPLFQNFVDKKNLINYNDFFTQLISFILTLISTMFFIKIAFNSFLGIKSKTAAAAAATVPHKGKYSSGHSSNKNEIYSEAIEE